MPSSHTTTLIVDDDPHLLSGTARLLRSVGYRVIEAVNGRECLRLAREEKPDLILVDVVLPDINGLEVCRRLKADEASRGSLVILWSSLQTGSDELAKGLERGADGYIARPLPGRELLARIQALVRLKHARDALTDSEARYRTLVDLLPIGVFVVQESQIVFANQAGCGLLGAASVEELSHRVFLDFVHPDYHAIVQQRQHDMMAKKQAVPPLEEVFIRLDGSLVEVEKTAAPITYNRQPAILLSVTDISERRQAEREYAQLIAELQAKNDELDRFAATVAHNLKSPLVTIQGFLAFLEQDIARGESRRIRSDMKQIGSAVENMEGLVNKLLKLSRLGHVADGPQVVSMAELVQEAVNLMAGGIAARGVQIDIQPNLPDVTGDRQRLIEVWQNLIENAVNYVGDQPHPKIWIGLRHDRDEAVFYIRDNGQGIEPRHQQQIFDLFERLETRNDGSGIGLALVRRIIEWHGGRVWVESEGEGRGSIFCFTLPKNQSKLQP